MNSTRLMACELSREETSERESAESHGYKHVPGRPGAEEGGERPPTREEHAIMMLRERVHLARRPLMLEKKSVYGAAILVPQLARTAGWAWDLQVLSVKVYIFLALNFFLQSMLLANIEREESVMDLFAGQMFLCDFGAPIDPCPDDPSCLGPGGTQISAPRMYNFPTWVSRKFVKESLKAVFPERSDVVDKHVDPGEYGAESRSTRVLCCFIFMTQVLNELEMILNMARLLYRCPSIPEPWVDLVPPEGADGTFSPFTFAHSTSGEADSTTQHCIFRVKVAGMPLHWKIINIFLVWVPKLLLWSLTAQSGVTFLMETSEISDMIINAVALSFILTIDETIFEALMSDASKELLEDCVDLEREEKKWLRRKATASNLTRTHLAWTSLLRGLWKMLPTRLLVVTAMTGIFVVNYYLDHCNWQSTGGWFKGWFASKPMYLPLTTDFTLLNTFFPYFFPVERERTAFWQMPSPVDLDED